MQTNLALYDEIHAPNCYISVVSSIQAEAVSLADYFLVYEK